MGKRGLTKERDTLENTRILSAFWRFCVVGASGVGVNLFTLALGSYFGLLSTLSSAFAIEVSICSNFVLNERWTFSASRMGSSGERWVRFQLVSLIGASIQWSCFVLANLLWLYLGWTEGTWATYQEVWHNGSWAKPITDPPDVGGWIYLSQAVGVGVATGWNFFANFYWTWRAHNSP